MAATRTPKYRRQKSRPVDRAFVELDGRKHYLGQHGTAESKQRYHQLLAEWTVNGRQLCARADQITIVELVAKFWKHVETYYRKPNGKPTASLYLYQAALRPLKQLYGRTSVAEFGPGALRAVRSELLETGISRGVINRYVNLIRSVFRWGVAQELVPVDVHTALTAIDGLRRGRTKAGETKPSKPVSEAHVEAVQAYVSRQAWALIQLQLHTAARGGELVMMRAIDIDTAGKVWMYGPADHRSPKDRPKLQKFRQQARNAYWDKVRQMTGTSGALKASGIISVNGARTAAPAGARTMTARMTIKAKLRSTFCEIAPLGPQDLRDTF